MRTHRDRSSSLNAIGWVLLALLGLVAAFLGGSSRPDAVQLIALRPLAALFFMPALYFLTRERLSAARLPVVLLALLALWMALQLVPLPPFLWHALPGRGPVEALDAALGLEDQWRPISLVPSRGWNALASLVLPAAGLLLALAVRAPARVLLLLVAGLGLLDAALGMLQIMDGAGSKLYFYEFTGRGAAVGMFANENHSGVFSALALVVVAHLATDREFGLFRQWQRVALTGAFIFILMAALIGGSRAGFLTTILALAASAFMLWHHLTRRRRADRAISGVAAKPGWLLLISILAIGAMVAAFIALDRAPAFASIVNRSQFEDLRWEILPVLGEMLARFWLIGTGFGSFEEVYHIFEPDRLLFPPYINQAHNDWAQLVIEGGLPAALIAGAALFGLARRLARMARSADVPASRCMFWLAATTLVLSASLVDYPLRAPVFQLVVAWMAIAFCRELGDADGGSAHR